MSNMNYISLTDEEIGDLRTLLTFSSNPDAANLLSKIDFRPFCHCGKHVDYLRKPTISDVCLGCLENRQAQERPLWEIFEEMDNNG